MKNGIEKRRLDRFIEKIGGIEVYDDVLEGKIILYPKKNESSFFDDSGRRIIGNLSANVCDADQEFFFDNIQLTDKDYKEKIMVFRNYCHDQLTFNEFKTKVDNLIEAIKSNHLISNVLKGPWFPIILPTTKDHFNIGQVIRHDIESIGENYRKTFPGRNFLISSSFSETTLNKQGRQEELILMIMKNPIVGIYFPSALQGFSVPASREQMISLPEGFYLSGIDAVWAMIMYPEYLALNFNVPGIYLAGLEISEIKTPYLAIYDDRMEVISMPSPKNHADGGTTQGLLFSC